jgi:uncharacterized protein (DUF1330 family)
MRVFVITERVERGDASFMPEYRRLSAPSIEKYGARYVTSSFNNVVIEGDDMGKTSNLVSILEFESREAAERWYYSEEYQAAMKVRQQGWKLRVMIVDVDSSRQPSATSTVSPGA